MAFTIVVLEVKTTETPIVKLYLSNPIRNYIILRLKIFCVIQ